MKLRKRVGLAVVAAFVFALPATPAFAGTLTLHPNGFGTNTYTSWKAKQGERDTLGNDNQALYFQKFVPTPTFTAAVAEIKGVEGMKLSDLTGLAWDHREDGHCGAGAPRWDVVVADAMGNEQTLFFGCNAAQHTELAPASGHGWCRDTQQSPASIPGASNLTIKSLAIVFDEGNDTPNPPPAGCNQEQPAGGFVYLDNITVTTSTGEKTWTSANDNGNK